MNEPAVKVENLVKRYKELVAVDHLNLEIRQVQMVLARQPQSTVFCLSYPTIWAI